eukprot:gb/GECG01002960.1/.p1 GENE.gb/GECG01002960.1/~~gb/GECG01002960.1/.p1  ORF type:complete len:260 (+),score=48.92 gb/GECG01002960.1/:1-780(+)
MEASNQVNGGEDLHEKARQLAKAAIQRGHHHSRRHKEDTSAATTASHDGDEQKSDRRRELLQQIAQESFGELSASNQQPAHGEEDQLAEVVHGGGGDREVDKALKQSDNYGESVKHDLRTEPHSKKKSLRRAERAKQPETAGKGWFDMQAPVMTDEVKRDLEVLRNRNYLDPKRFFKTKEEKKPPKFFQIGTVVEGALEGRSKRIAKKQRPQSFFHEVATDDRVKSYAKRNYSEMLKTAMSGRVPKDKTKGKVKKRKHK